MDLGNPFLGIFPTVDSAVLSVLAGTTKPRTGREIARLADRSQSATQRVLDRLVDQGVVFQEDAGRSRIYTLNRMHLAAEAISDLAALRSSLFRRLQESLDFWVLPPRHLSVFGSVARGDGDIESDIDIFLVRPSEVVEDDSRWRRQVDLLSESVFEWTGNHAGIAEVGDLELDRYRVDEPGVLARIRAEGIDLYGTPLRKLLPRS